MTRNANAVPADRWTIPHTIPQAVGFYITEKISTFGTWLKAKCKPSSTSPPQTDNNPGGPSSRRRASTLRTSRLSVVSQRSTAASQTDTEAFLANGDIHGASLKGTSWVTAEGGQFRDLIVPANGAGPTMREWRRYERGQGIMIQKDVCTFEGRLTDDTVPGT